MWDKYFLFQDTLRSFRKDEYHTRGDMQKLIPRNTEGAFAIILYYAASCLNYADPKRCETRKLKYDPVLTDEWVPDQVWLDRLAGMNISPTGGYTGTDKGLLLVHREESLLRKPSPGMEGFLPLFSAWQDELQVLAKRIYPSGELAAIIKQICDRAKAAGEFHVTDLKPNRQTESYRVKGMPKELGMPYASKAEEVEPKAKQNDIVDMYATALQTENDLWLEVELQKSFDYADLFKVENWKAKLKPGQLVFQIDGRYYVQYRGEPFDIEMSKAHLNDHLRKLREKRCEQVKNDMLAGEIMHQQVKNDMLRSEAFRQPPKQSEEDLHLQKVIRDLREEAAFFLVVDGKAVVQEGGVYEFTDYGERTFTIRGKKYRAEAVRAELNKLLQTIQSNKETSTMTKTNSFVTSVKGIFGDVIRMQRGRAAVHATKRIIFAAFPIQWGVLARITGKAKKVEDHPLTDVAVALLAHGAANALLDDPAKRAKYLKYTEEMVAASVANAGFKMVPVEEILDKVLKGAVDSEAVQKVKSVLKDAE